jgi:hypothetical protein
MTKLAPYYVNKETGISYTLSPEGYYIPDLALPPQPEGNLNRWGRTRLSYLREHKPLLHTHMLTQCTLWPHLLEIQETATKRMELLTTQMAAAEGVTGGLEVPQSNALGGQGEQHPRMGRGGNQGGVDLQLTAIT